MTIDSESEDIPRPGITQTRAVKLDAEDVDLSPEFIFDTSGDPYSDIVGYDADFEAVMPKGSKLVSQELVTVA